MADPKVPTVEEVPLYLSSITPEIETQCFNME